MIVFLNGRFVPEEEAVVSVFDRSFLYGDGLFETVRIHRGTPFRWRDHYRRLEQGAQLLGISLRSSEPETWEQITELARMNQMPEALLRLTLSRGVGQRGYSPRGADSPTLVMTLHPAPDASGQNAPQWRLKTSSFRLPENERLARYKTCNKLPQILARAEAQAAGDDEGLLLNTRGEVVEASSGNLFWVKKNVICTPPLASGILAGITRTVVLEMCRELGLPTSETGIAPAELARADGVFLSLSSWGIIAALTLDGFPLAQNELVQTMRDGYRLKMSKDMDPE